MQSATCDRYTKPESVFCAFNRIYKQEGIRGLYRVIKLIASYYYNYDCYTSLCTLQAIFVSVI